jgi:membrane-associated phospholipid phosphatase
MESRFARVISYIFHPLLIPTYAYIILLHLQVYFSMIIPSPQKWLIISLIFITTFLFPTIISLFLVKRKLVKTMEMHGKEERTLPYMITVVFFYLTYYLLKKLQISPIFYYFMAGATFLVIITLVINLFWKISGHMISIGSMVGAIIGLSILMNLNLTGLIIIMITISGIVAYARLRLNAHYPTQVYTGFLMGFVFMAGLFLIL